MKDAGLRIRIQRELRDQFLEACRVQDKPAAQVLREFIREGVSLILPPGRYLPTKLMTMIWLHATVFKE
jgi:hypothetical protein